MPYMRCEIGPQLVREYDKAFSAYLTAIKGITSQSEFPSASQRQQIQSASEERRIAHVALRAPRRACVECGEVKYRASCLNEQSRSWIGTSTRWEAGKV